MTLTEFLLARIAEDESHLGYMRSHLADYTFPARPLADSYSRRVLAECEAHRRIVERFARLESRLAEFPNLTSAEAVAVLRQTVMDLASVYADDPDYDEAWRP